MTTPSPCQKMSYDVYSISISDERQAGWQASKKNADYLSIASHPRQRRILRDWETIDQLWLEGRGFMSMAVTYPVLPFNLVTPFTFVIVILPLLLHLLFLLRNLLLHTAYKTPGICDKFVVL